MNRLCVALLLIGCGGSAPEPAATVATAEPIRGGFQLERQSFTTNVDVPTRVEIESTASTAEDGRGALRLDGGAWVLLDRNTSAIPALEALELKSGRAWIDARDTEMVVRTPNGEIRAVDATFDVQVGETVEAYCASGELSWIANDQDGRVAQGESLVLSAEPSVRPERLWNDWTGGLADPRARRDAVAGYVGVLAGRGLDQFGRARRPLAIRAHEVDAAIHDDFASTTVIQTFFNAESTALEAEYRLRIPRDAVVNGFAVDLGGGFVEATVQPMSSRGYGLDWDDPSVATSRLSYDGPDRLRARVHPVQPGATVRVKVSYAQWLDRRGDRRTYHYPMHSEDTRPPRVGELRVRVDTGRTEVGAHRAGMGATVDGNAVVVRRSDWQPSADFYLDLIDGEDEERPEGASAYVVDAPAEPGADGTQQFVLIDVPTEAITAESEADGLDVVVVVDVSGATNAEDLELARAIVESVATQLAPDDRIAIRVGDVSAHTPEGASDELAPANDATREAILESLARAQLGGATDLGAMLRDAADVVANRPKGVVIYVGDATPTTGAMETTSLRQQLASIPDAPRFFGLAVGEGSNVELLRSLFTEPRTVSVQERTDASRAVMRLLARAAEPGLRNVQLDLGSGIERVFPRPPIALTAGKPLRVVGRLREDLPSEVTIRGALDGAAFETKMPLTRRTLDDQGDIRRRWAVARLQELIDADEGREALVELGVRFGVLTPWTSYVALGGKVDGYWPVRGFDRDPVALDWAAGGGAPRETSSRGWRRRRAQAAPEPVPTLERTWVSRVSTSEEEVTAGNDGGLGRAAVARALQRSERGPQACYERRLLVRPDLRGMVQIEVEVDGDGSVKDAKIVRGLGESGVDACILTEIRGVRFPATGSNGVRVTHSFHFESSGRGLGTQRQCSDASRQDLSVRLNLWRERLNANAGPGGALAVWREASRQCELSSWRARRQLLRLLLRAVPSVDGRLTIYRGLGGDASVRTYLRRAILAGLRTPQDVALARTALGLDAQLQWQVFSRLWKRAANADAKLALVRRWLEVVPEEMDLRLRLLALLEETNRFGEAEELAYQLRADPLADARTRTAVGEFWLRRDNEKEARRVFSELVERTPYDPWARQRLGDLYRAHGWHDDAYREYRALSRLRPDDDGVLLLLARAAAGAGRTDEALRLEQRLAETVDAGHLEGVAAISRLWTTTRLAAMKAEASADELARLRRRERRTGVLRNPPAVLITLTWPHPEDAPQLSMRLPSTPEETSWERAPVSAPLYGLEGASIRELAGDETIRLQIRRTDADGLRDWQSVLTVIVGLGTPEERILRQELTLNRDRQVQEFTLQNGVLESQSPTNP